MIMFMFIGDYMLWDSTGGTRGIVRVSLRWKYPFQSVKAPQYYRERDQPEREIPEGKRKVPADKGPHATMRPIAKPRLKVIVCLFPINSVMLNI